MKLESINVYIIKTPPPHLGGHYHHYIKLTCDNGLVGWGETAVSHALNGLDAGYVGMLSGLFDKFYKGRNPLERELLWDRAYAMFSFQHPDFIGSALLSALDTALWDLCGKYYNTPIYNLLGGRSREKVRSYSYLMDPLPNAYIDAYTAGPNWIKSPEAAVEAALKMKEDGFDAFKIDPIAQIHQSGIPSPPWQLSLKEIDDAATLIGMLRDAVGRDVDIIIGTHGQPTPASMIMLAHCLEPFDPMWLEEPVPPENAEAMAEVARATRIPVASGERLATVHDFHRLFSAKAAAVAQPDLGSCGGITQAKKIAVLAEPHYVLMAPHVYGGPIITAAALQLDMNIKNFLIQESMYTSNHFFDELVEEPFRWEKGYFEVPGRPGLGVNLREDTLKKYSV